MRNFLKKRILKLIQTMYEVHGDIEEFINQKKWKNTTLLLGDCRDAAIQIGTQVGNELEDGSDTVKFLEEYCEYAYQISTELSNESNGKQIKRQLDRFLIRAENSVRNDVKVKLEIVFCPYKASMWDSLESVWKAAAADPDCDTYVVPIPYYDRNPDLSLGNFHYEGNEFPKDVPITYYENYDFQNRRPDVIYIHNPYDGNNYVTSVEPRFYSEKLKQCTEQLVYIPYGISGYFQSRETAARHIPSCMEYVDIFVAQSEIHKEVYSANGRYTNKIAILGSPKVDRVINELGHVEIPQELLDKINCRKTILVNSSITNFLGLKNWKEQIEHLLDVIEKETTIFWIWRPHPLLFTTLHAMRPNQRRDMLAVIERFRNLENVFIDDTPFVEVAFAVSDAMVSDYSSLIMQYTATGKPSLVMSGSSALRETDYLICCDYFSNYFMEDGTTLEEFCSMVKANQDEKKEERMKYFRNSMVNTDGSCGIKIHRYVKEREEN